MGDDQHQRDLSSQTQLIAGQEDRAHGPVFLLARRRRGAFAIALAPLVCACSASPEHQAIGTQQAPIVYGEDDRLDYFEVPTQALRRLLAERSVALFRSDSVETREGAEPTVHGVTLAESRQLCEGEPFEDQVAAAMCSGVLVQEDLVLTASHCLEYVPCAAMTIVRGFHYDAPEELNRLTSSDVARCGEVIPLASRDEATSELSWVVLSQPITLPYGSTLDISRRKTRQGMPVTLLSNTDGLPTKADSGGVVLDPGDELESYFTLTTDSFHGSSGGGVFDQSFELRGILIRGGTDYRWTSEDCATTLTVQTDLINMEEVASYAAPALDELCRSDDRYRSLCPMYCSEHACTVEASSSDAVALGGGGCSHIPTRGSRQSVLPLSLLALIPICRRRVGIGLETRRRNGKSLPA